MSNNTKPSYRLVPTIRTPNVDPGGTVEVAIYLTGFGNIDQNKIDITYSHPYVLSKNKPGKMTSYIYLNSIADGWIIPQFGEDYAYEIPLKREGTVSNVFSLFISEPEVQSIWEDFNRIGNLSIAYTTSPMPSHPTLYPRILGELAYGDSNPPLLMELNTADSPRLRDYFVSSRKNTAKPGDYHITFTLTYGSGNETFQDQSRVSFHVRSWVERNIRSLRIAALVTSVIAIIPVLKSIGVLSAFFITQVPDSLWVVILVIFPVILISFILSYVNHRLEFTND